MAGGRGGISFHLRIQHQLSARSLADGRKNERIPLVNQALDLTHILIGTVHLAPFVDNQIQPSTGVMPYLQHIAAQVVLTVSGFAGAEYDTRGGFGIVIQLDFKGGGEIRQSEIFVQRFDHIGRAVNRRLKSILVLGERLFLHSGIYIVLRQVVPIRNLRGFG